MAQDQKQDIYDPSFVKDVFDRCSAGYRFWSHVTSFGFVERWRRQCVQALPPPPSATPSGYDLMAGTGEVWPHLLKRFGAIKTIIAVDISTSMHQRAVKRLHAMRSDRITAREANVLTSDLPDDSADFVISTFGMKTFNRQQQAEFARTVARVLLPGGSFSIIEASDPRGWILRPLYNLYIRQVLPLVEKLLLNGAQDFSMFGIYCDRFGDCSGLARDLREAGLEVTERSYFFGCATGVSGIKPRA